MLNNLLENFWSILQTSAVIVGAIIALYVYKSQEKRKIINAATLIKLDIDSVEKAVNKLYDKKDYESIFQTEAIYQKLEWFAQRHLLISKIGADHVDSINEFFSSVVLLEEARASCKMSVLKNRHSKIQATQNCISELLAIQVKELFPIFDKTEVPAMPYSTSIVPNDIANAISTHIENQLNTYNRFFDNHHRDFNPNGITMYYSTALSKYKNISNTPAYEAIKKAANLDKV